MMDSYPPNSRPPGMVTEGSAPASRLRRLTGNRSGRVMLSILGVIVLFAGVWGRFHQLGAGPLAEDEYYFVQSVRFILDSGLPEFPDGGYYLRAVPLQYLTAASVMVFGDGVFADRLPAAVFSMLTVLVAFHYARHYVGTAGALAVAAALLVSSWEIEFGRFARMYTGLQFVCVAFLASLPECRCRAGAMRYLPHFLLSLGIIIQPVALAFIPLLFIDLVLDWDRQRRLPWGAAVATSGVMGVFLALHVLTGLATEVGPENAAANLVMEPTEFLVLPSFPFWSVSADPKVNLALIAGLLSVSALISFLWKRSVDLRCQLFFSLALLIFAATHQFAAAGVVCLIMMLRFKVYRFRDQPRWSNILLGLSILAGVVWIGVAALHPAQLAQAVPGDFFKAGRTTFIGWPDFYQAGIAPWFRTLPLISAALVLALLIEFVVEADRPLLRILENPALPLLMFLVFIGCVASPQSTTRYSFFLYPTVLLLILHAFQSITRKFGSGNRMVALSPVLGFSVVFICSGDFRPQHIAGISSPEVLFRMGEYSETAEHWIHRFDYIGPAEFLNRNTSPTEPLIVSARERPIFYYLKRPYALFLPKSNANFPLVARKGGTVERWSSKKMLTVPEDVAEHTADARVVWYVRRVKPGNISTRDFEFDEVWGRRLIDVKRAFLGADGHAEVLRITLEPEGPVSDPEVPDNREPAEATLPDK